MTTTTRKGVNYGPHGEIQSCLFCRILSKQEPGCIVYEDENYVAFKTIAPATEHHVLVCPRKHVQNYHALSGPSGARLVRSLVDTGRIALGADAEDAQWSFHIPPFNSIDHLHMHAIGRRHTLGLLNGLKYWEGSYWCKSAEVAINELEQTLDRPERSTTTTTSSCPVIQSDASIVQRSRL